jgi:ABC-type amino acid transport substrate-binding protein
MIGYTRAAPFIIADQDQLEGLSIWLWEKIAKDLDLPYKMELMGFNSILAGLEAGTIDASINPLTITSERSKKMDFTHSFFASNSTVAIRPSSSFKKFNQFIRSFFSLNFLRAMLALMLIIALFGFATWCFERRHNESQFRRGWAGIWDGLWWSAVTMTTVGYGDKTPQSTGGKLIALIWMFTALLFISGFTASIASSLTINQLQWSPNEVSDFKKQKVGCVGASATLDYLRTHFFNDIKLYDGLQDGLKELVDKEIDAFLYDEPILKHRITNDAAFQQLEVLPIKFDLQFYAFAFAKEREDIKDLVSQKILEHIESMEWRFILAEYDLSQL